MDLSTTGGGNNCQANAALGGLAAVATKIRDRALQLEAAQRELQTSHSDRTAVQSNLTGERRTNDQLRTRLLEAVRSRHGVELEVLQVQEGLAGLEGEIDAAMEESRSLRAATASYRSHLDGVAAAVYARHESEAETHLLAAETAVREADDRRRKRERLMDDAALQTARWREEAETFRAERERLMEEADELDDREEAEDEEVTALAMQIRATLKKVSLHTFLCACVCGIYTHAKLAL